MYYKPSYSRHHKTMYKFSKKLWCKYDVIWSRQQSCADGYVNAYWHPTKSVILKLINEDFTDANIRKYIWVSRSCIVLDRVCHFQPIPIYRFFAVNWYRYDTDMSRQWTRQNVTERWKVTDAAAMDDSCSSCGGRTVALVATLLPCPPAQPPSAREGKVWQPHPYYWDIQTRSPTTDRGKVDLAIINQQVGQDHHTSVYIFLGRAADKCRRHTARPLLSPASGLPVDQQQH